MRLGFLLEFNENNIKELKKFFYDKRQVTDFEELLKTKLPQDVMMDNYNIKSIKVEIPTKLDLNKLNTVLFDIITDDSEELSPREINAILTNYLNGPLSNYKGLWIELDDDSFSFDQFVECRWQ